jgi:hypothetical protein
MAEKVAGYGRKWKKWLGIYAVAAVVLYGAIFLLFMNHGAAAGGGGFHY